MRGVRVATIQQLARALQDVADRGRVIRLVAAELDAVIPDVEEGIRQRAVEILPTAGGLGGWVAALTIRSSVRVAARRARATLVGYRRSMSGNADIAAIDRGRVRHPAWGRRGPNDWYIELVTPGFFSKAEESSVWGDAAQRGLNRAWDEVR
jgi:hypothetical protein